eukprot:TRINITY_DN30737_c0_g1_i2.p2 TRINITY_DN30737_c0_g1~~TRINITY_DN30737_c0_g1_i2.p2  ORF type:complete len:114 (-),score=20.24 TRINITY_DN30737_c0_g1_i2:98-439(-)
MLVRISIRRARFHSPWEILPSWSVSYCRNLSALINVCSPGAGGGGIRLGAGIARVLGISRTGEVVAASGIPIPTFEFGFESVSYTHLRAHETPEHLVCRLLLEKKKKESTLNN